MVGINWITARVKEATPSHKGGVALLQSEMGNTGSAGSVSEHVEQARKTGVCSLKDRKLTKVRYGDVAPAFLL